MTYHDIRPGKPNAGVLHACRAGSLLQTVLLPLQPQGLQAAAGIQLGLRARQVLSGPDFEIEETCPLSVQTTAEHRSP